MALLSHASDELLPRHCGPTWGRRGVPAVARPRCQDGRFHFLSELWPYALLCPQIWCEALLTFYISPTAPISLTLLKRHRKLITDAGSCVWQADRSASTFLGQYTALALAAPAALHSVYISACIYRCVCSHIYTCCGLHAAMAGNAQKLLWIAQLTIFQIHRIFTVETTLILCAACFL